MKDWLDYPITLAHSLSEEVVSYKLLEGIVVTG